MPVAAASSARPYPSEHAAPPAPTQVSEAAGLLLRDSFCDAARTIDPLLRQIQRDHHGGGGLSTASRHGSFVRVPSSNANDSLAKISSFARNPHGAASPNGLGGSGSTLDLSDNDAAAIFVIAGFSHLFAMVDPKWARSIAVQLTDRYPMFAIGFVLRAEAEAASGDFPAAYNLLSKVERDIRLFEGGAGRSLYTALAPPSAAASGANSPARAPSPPADDHHHQHGSIATSSASSPRLLGSSHMTDDDTDPAPLGFMCATSASFIRAVWLHVTSRRLAEDASAGASNAAGFRSLSTGKLHEESADVDLVLRYACAARTQLQQQEARWLRYRALLEFSRHVGATVHPCSKCGAVPSQASAPPTQWRCATCIAKHRGSSSSSQSTPRHSGSSVATSSTGGADPRRRSSNGLGAQLGEPQQAPIGTPRSPAGSFAFYRQHYDAATDAPPAATAGGTNLAAPPTIATNGRNSGLGTTTLTGPPTPHAGGLAPTTGSFAGSFSGSFSSSDFGAVSSSVGGSSSSWKAAGGTSSAGRVWAPDTGSSCQRCAKSVGRMTRHHCRSCGRLVCGPCSQKRREVPLLGFTEAVRVCANCADVLDSSASQRASPQHSPGLGPRGSEETLPDAGDD